MRHLRMYAKRWLLVYLWVAVSILIFGNPARAQMNDDEASGNGRTKAEVAATIESLRKEVAASGHTFVVGDNPAMRRSIEQLCGLKEPKGWKSYAPFVEVKPFAAVLPSSWDWRTLNGVTPVKNQGNCGSCWAFGTVAPIEGAIKTATGLDKDLAEQYLISCNTDGYGCNGGWFAHEYYMWNGITPPGEQQPGAVLESNFPYTADDGACNPPHSHPYDLQSWAYISSQSNVPSVQAIKQAITDHGVVAAAVCVGPKFQAYTGGIFNANEASSCGGSVNHAIALVGWTDDLGPDSGYWIMKNSWGAGWGESGYMRIRYGMSNIGYAANYVQLQNTPPPPPPSDLPKVSITATNATVRERSMRRGTCTVSRVGSTASALTVKYALSGTAVNGVDYSKLSGSLTIRAGATSASISIYPRDRQLRDGNKTVIVTLSPDTAYDIAAPASATVTITDYTRRTRARSHAPHMGSFDDR